MNMTYSYIELVMYLIFLAVGIKVMYDRAKGKDECIKVSSTMLLLLIALIAMLFGWWIVECMHNDYLIHQLGV